MNIVGKILSSFVTVAFAIIGGLWTAYTVLNSTMDSKVAQATDTMRIERTAQIGELRSEIKGIHALVESIDRKTDILIQKDHK